MNRPLPDPISNSNGLPNGSSVVVPKIRSSGGRTVSSPDGNRSDIKNRDCDKSEFVFNRRSARLAMRNRKIEYETVIMVLALYPPHGMEARRQSHFRRKMGFDDMEKFRRRFDRRDERPEFSCAGLAVRIVTGEFPH